MANMPGKRRQMTGNDFETSNGLMDEVNVRLLELF